MDTCAVKLDDNEKTLSINCYKGIEKHSGQI